METEEQVSLMDKIMDAGYVIAIGKNKSPKEYVVYTMISQAVTSISMGATIKEALEIAITTLGL